ncbi:hypothetical protein Atai01_74330 [Amycolatopsis taiwanensis]|uniref:Integral membrane protein n=1 Tax=Amycolatopsis taiwanensis TaxID=342230 RepID=A0A9W6R846_9PSEU|nr:hypothetical protein Atai01_74330 [Amycolatopsis taiwanensis]
MVAAAGIVIRWLHWYPVWRIYAFAPPLYGAWLPHVGWGTPVATVLAVAVLARGPELARRLAWRRLCVLAYLATVAWTLALAMIDGWQGLASRLAVSTEYLHDVPRVTNITAMLHTFTSHIIAGQPDSWTVQVSGHPPGAFLVFVWLDRIGLGGGGPAALACALVGCLAAVAVPATIRTLGDEQTARAAAPFAVLFPGAVWVGASADGLFTGVTSVGVLLVAHGATRLRGSLRWSRAIGGPAMSVAGGALLGFGLFLSYGLVLMAPIAAAACWAARSWRAPVCAALGAAAVAGAFAAAGFWWLDGYHLVVRRYYQDVGFTRPYNYWVWANLASLVLAAGPAAAPGLRRAVLVMPRRTGGPVVALVIGAAIAMAVADLSGLAKAEVERIWLPFAAWLTSAAALLPAASRRWWLLGQALTALAVHHLVLAPW